MKYTAIDLTHKKIGRSVRGYKTSEVDDLLRDISSELEESARDRARMESQMEQMRSEIARYKQMEETLNNSILLAQRTADEVRAAARRDADVVIKEAEQTARRMVEDASRERQETHNELRRATERRDMFIDTLRGASRDLAEWLQHRRWEEVIAIPAFSGDNGEPADEHAAPTIVEAKLSSKAAGDGEVPAAALEQEATA